MAANNINNPLSDVGTAIVIVAHPDDETLWAAGLILANPQIAWSIATLCRASDHDRAPKFAKAAARLSALGCMADMDDGPRQQPLDIADVAAAIAALPAKKDFDLVITHSPRGEYTRHLRHEETARAVLKLLYDGRLTCRRLLMFAYGDNGRKHPPRALETADIIFKLPDTLWQSKYDIITEIYGFSPNSFEARTCPATEAFWSFHCAPDAMNKFDKGDKK